MSASCREVQYCPDFIADIWGRGVAKALGAVVKLLTRVPKLSSVIYFSSFTSGSFQTAPLCFHRSISSLKNNCLARANDQTKMPIFNLLGQQKVTLQSSWKKLVLHYNLLLYENRNSPKRNSWGVACFQGLEKSFAASVTDKLEIKFMKRKKMKLCAKYLLLFCLTNT